MSILLAYLGSYTLVIYIIVRVFRQIIKEERYSFWKDKWIVVCGIITLICDILVMTL